MSSKQLRKRIGLVLFASMVVSVHCRPACGQPPGNISDIVDFQLVGAPFPQQFLYDDTQPLPEFLQTPDPLAVVNNTGAIAQPFYLELVRPEIDGDTRGIISDVVAVVPMAGNTLALRYWSDDPTANAAAFIASLGPNSRLVGTIVEDGWAHDVNGPLLGANSPFAHVIVASDVLAAGILPGLPRGGGGPGSIAISETLAFRNITGGILNQGMHGAAMYDGPGFTEVDYNVFQVAAPPGVGGNIYLKFVEGAHGDQDQTQNPADILAMKRVNGMLIFGEWSEDLGTTAAQFVTNFYAGAGAPTPIDSFIGPDGNRHLLDETQGHPPLMDPQLLNLQGMGLPFTRIDFKSDPPIPEPSTLMLLGTGLVGLFARWKLRTSA